MELLCIHSFGGLRFFNTAFLPFQKLISWRPFDAGADDFNHKPVRLKSLVRRMQAGAQHPGRNIFFQAEKGTALSSVKVNPESYGVFLSTRAGYVSRKEYELPFMMVSGPSKSSTGLSCTNRSGRNMLYATAPSTRIFCAFAANRESIRSKSRKGSVTASAPEADTLCWSGTFFSAELYGVLRAV